MWSNINKKAATFQRGPWIKYLPTNLYLFTIFNMAKIVPMEEIKKIIDSKKESQKIPLLRCALRMAAKAGNLERVKILYNLLNEANGRTR